MQEPNILPLFQTIPKAEAPLSFLETKRPSGPIRVIIGTAADNPCLWGRENAQFSFPLDRANIPLCYNTTRTMSTDEKILKVLEDLQADVKAMKGDVG